MADDFARFGVNTYAFTQTATALEAMKLFAGAGFRRFELMVIPGHLWTDESAASIREITAFATGEGCEILSVNTANIDINVASATPEMRAYSVDLVEAMIRLAGKLGAKGFILGPGKPNPLFPLPTAQLEDYFFAALDRLSPAARDSGVALWAENMPFSFLPAADALCASLERYGDEGIGICYDIANAHFIGEDPRKGLERIASRLALVHVSDTTRQLYRHDPIGAGDVDFEGVRDAIRASRAPDVMFEIIGADPVQDASESARRLIELGY